MKKKVEAEKENSERWLLTYSDMITLLMVFFVVLYAMSTADKAKFEVLAESLSVAFGGDITQPPSGIGSGQGRVITLSPQEIARIPAQSKKARASTYDNVYTLLKTEVKAGKMSVIQEERGVIVQLGANFFFKAGSADLPMEDAASLVTLAQALASIGNELQIEGFADSMEAQGPEASTEFATSWDLASKRAINLLNFLEEQGVPAERLRAVTFGSTKAVAENEAPEGRAYNRHVDILILYGSESSVVQ